MDPITLITEIKPLLSARLTGEQQQRLPFTQGQFLQGMVTAKGDAHLFTLDLNGQQVTAESSTPLQIGQKLNLQIVALTPRMELQVVSPEPANRWLGNVLPLLGKEPLLLPQLATVADDPPLMALLKPATQETLLLFAGRQSTGSASPAPLPVPTLINQLTNLLAHKTLATPEPGLRNSLQEIVTLLQDAGRSGSLDPKTAATANRLADFFSQQLVSQQSSIPGQPIAAGPQSTGPLATGPKEIGAALEFLVNLAGLKSSESALLTQLLSLNRAYASLPADHPLQQLLSFMVQTTSDHALPFLAQGAAEHLGERYSRLGLNMEQLLAGDKPEAATHTLKFALLELAQQAGAAVGRGGIAADQLGQLIELYQLVQHRLTNESLIFIPLPFPFLQQGYALLESDRSDGEAEAANKRAGQDNPSVALHLRLEGLGNLQIEIRRQEDRVAIRFLAENAEKAKFIAEFRQELEQWLTSGKLESVQFLIGAQEPIKSLLEKIMPQGEGMIDTRA
ncbi:flagellar hook-length control protein FliK [Desulfobulbus sp.]|uniref:flagellar hook-length control protein FliK n=1 Tax=Desulfobulbus sp. TaxID=895 RepID=UPI00286F9470|nr:flagellar hook-length control protein FliK [Desulfobulbus sp.]